MPLSRRISMFAAFCAWLFVMICVTTFKIIFLPDDYTTDVSVGFISSGLGMVWASIVYDYLRY